jgi:hypothetical protein
MSLIDHTDKIVFIKDYLVAEDREYLLIYGSKASGKFYTVKQAYNVLDDNSKSSLYLTVIRNDSPTHYGDKTATKRKTILIREELDSVGTNFINGWSAEVREFFSDPVHTLYAIRNLDLEFRRWMRSLRPEDATGPLLDLIPLRDEFININYNNSTADVLVYICGLRGASVSVTFNEGVFELTNKITK